MPAPLTGPAEGRRTGAVTQALHHAPGAKVKVESESCCCMRLLLAAVLVAPILAGCVTSTNDSTVDDVEVSLSTVRFTDILREQTRVASSMDGSELVVDIWRPETDEPVPVILVQSPYWSFLFDSKANDRPTWYIDYFVPRGYAVALGEMRGTRDSGGCWDFGGPLDRRDGHDMVEFLGAQSWSNGNVGMLGQSHVGMSQVAAAVTAPPSLKAVVPIAAVTDWYKYLHKDGAPYVLNRGTPPAYFAVHASPSYSVLGGDDATSDWVLRQAETACPDNVEHLSKAAELDGTKDQYWQDRDLVALADNINAAVFLVHGFLDENVKTDHFLDLWRALPDDVPKKAWVGQWYHEHPPYYEWRDDLHRWFDHFLKGMDNGIMDEPTFTVQDNRYLNRTETQWPASGHMTWALDGDGVLRSGEAQADGDTFGYVQQPGDDRGWIADRAGMSLVSQLDHVAFTTGALDAPLHIAGEATLNVTMSILAQDARIIAALFDVGPSGHRDEITRTYLDARHRNGPESPQPIPLSSVAYHLTFYPRDHVVPAGHQLELVFFGGDQGCIVPTGDGDYSQTCEGTGVVPVAESHLILLHAGEDSGGNLVLPTVTEPGPTRPLTELDDWLDDLPE